MKRLQAEKLCKQFPTPTEPLVVLRDVSLKVDAGQTVAIVGPSGSGKSTLMNILGTLEPPSEGRVLFDGEDPATLGPAQLALFRNQRIGLVFQDHHLLPQLTVLENVLVPTIAGGPTRQESLDRANQLLKQVGLADRFGHRPGELSGGERQRVAIARALINEPAIVLADEPTGNLDETTADRVAELMLELQKEQKNILVVVTHSVRLASMMQQTLRLDHGALKTIESST